VNTKAGIAAPKDLEGKRVGVNRGYTGDDRASGSRTVLSHQYGVDLDKITWVLSGDEHVAEFRPPSNVVPIEKGRRWPTSSPRASSPPPSAWTPTIPT
jgi:4,5-dihydroxyphthalate decarboxylase